MNALRTWAGPGGILILIAGAGVSSFTPEHRLWGFVLMGIGGLFVVTAAWLNREDLANLLRGRAVRYGANAAFYSLLVLLIVGAVNFLSARHHRRFDATSEQVNTLAPQTVQVLRGLDSDVELIGFYTERNGLRQRFEDLGTEYRYYTPRLKVRAVDPLRAPGEARRYEIAQDGTVLVTSAAGEARITSLSEQDLTNAIVKATRKEKKTVCFTTGHGEASTADSKDAGYAAAASGLRKENYELKDVLLLQTGDVPAECSVLVVAGPQNPVHAGEAERIGRWLAAGGRLMVLKRDPRKETGLETLLAAYGLKVDADTIVDRLSRAIVGDEFSPVVAAYEDHPVTKALLEERVASLFPVASSVEATAATEPNVTAQVLARTGADSWGETGEVVQFDPTQDHAGPVGLVAAASGPPVAPAADANAPADPNAAAPRDRRLVLAGDSDFAANGYLGWSGNMDLFLNAVAWLAEESDLISIRPRENRPQPVALTAARQNLLSAISYLTPVVAIGVGLGVWLRRKRL